MEQPPSLTDTQLVQLFSGLDTEQGELLSNSRTEQDAGTASDNSLEPATNDIQRVLENFESDLRTEEHDECRKAVQIAHHTVKEQV